MQQVPSQFDGIAGQALRAALHRASWISGMALTSALFLAARGLGIIGRPEMFPAAAVMLVCLGLAYHAIADNQFVSTAGRTIAVGLQTALASALWFGPWMFWSNSLTPGTSLLESIGAPTPLAAAVWIFGSLVATPVLLIAATHSRNWYDVVSPAHWSRQFRGRGGDLMTVYTIQTGGLVLATVFSIPLAMLALNWNKTAGLAAVGLAACFVLGYWVALAGRLCGSIHRATALPAKEPASPPRFVDRHASAGPEPAASLNRDMPEQVEQLDDVQEPAVDAAPESEPPQPLDARAGTDAEAAPLRRYAAPSDAVAFDILKPSRKERRTPLLDAQARVEEAMKRFRLDPSHTLSRLAEINQRFAANPYVLQALTICLHRTGHADQAFKAARQAFPLCFDHGLVSLAAAMFYELRGQLHRLELKQDQVLSIAEVLHGADELAAAAKAYSLVIHADGREFGAIKGLLDVAQRILDERGKPEAALKVYMFLLEHCNDSGMTEVVRDAISRCREAEEAVQPTA